MAVGLFAPQAPSSPAPGSRRPVAFESVSRQLAASGIAITTTRRYLTPFVAYDPRSFSSLELFTAGTLAVTITSARMGLYSMAANGDWTLVAQTANDTTIGSTINSQFTRALDTTGGFPAAYALTPGNTYASAFQITAGTTPTVYGFATGNAGPAALLPRVGGFDNSGAGTDLNTTVTLANFSGVGTLYYGCGV